MNRKIYLLLTVLLAWSFNLKAQTAQIESKTANPGASVTFDIDVSGLPADVGAVSLFIGYDPNVLTYTGSTPGTLTGYFINNMTGTNQVGIQWSNPYGANLNGTLLTLNFQYSALGGSCELTFGPGCEFTDTGLNPVTITYINGSIGPSASFPTVTIDEILATAGPVTLNVVGAGFTTNAGGVTLFIDFDPDVLQFTGFTSALPLIVVNGNNTTGRVSVIWSDYTGASLNGTFLSLNFNYDGTGASELVFQSGCELVDVGLEPILASFDNGKVEPLGTTYNLFIEDEIDIPGSLVGIDITADGFPNTVGAITLHIGFNPAHLTYLSVSNGTISGISAGITGPGLLSINWTNSSGQAIDGKLLTINFDYNFGSSEITFEGGSELYNNLLQLIPTTFHDGSITQETGGAEAILPFKTGTAGQPISFPIRVKNFMPDPAAISLFIGFNSTVLTYTGHTPGTLTGYYINHMAASSQVGIQWSDYMGFDIDPNGDDILLTLHFMYNGGSGDLTFDAGCEFSKNDLTQIPVAFFDGGVTTGSRFNIKAFLEGPFNGTTMNVGLNSLGYLPISQPYNTPPWNYTGTESVGVIPNGNIVDWVLLEIRETAGAASTATSATMVTMQAAFILNNGQIVDLDGMSTIFVPMTFSDNVYVVVHHRNHLAMMSGTAVPLAGDIYTYDFTTGQAQAYNSGQKVVYGGYGMFAADGETDGMVDILDYLNSWVPQLGNMGYFSGDFNMDGMVDILDYYDTWIPNLGEMTQVP